MGVWSEVQRARNEEMQMSKKRRINQDNQNKDVIIEREPNCTLPQRVSATKEMKRHAPTRGIVYELKKKKGRLDRSIGGGAKELEEGRVLLLVVSAHA